MNYATPYGVQHYGSTGLQKPASPSMPSTGTPAVPNAAVPPPSVPPAMSPAVNNDALAAMFASFQQQAAPQDNPLLAKITAAGALRGETDFGKRFGFGRGSK